MNSPAAIASVLIASMLCITALVLHHDLPAHVLVSGGVAIIALLARSPLATPLEKSVLQAIAEPTKEVPK